MMERGYITVYSSRKVVTAAAIPLDIVRITCCQAIGVEARKR